MIGQLLPMLAVGALPFVTAGAMIGAAMLTTRKQDRR